MTNRLQRALIFATTAALALSACSSDDSKKASTGTGSESSTDSGGNADDVLNVPDEYPTIQKAVDASEPGDLILIAEGTYHEAVDVSDPKGDITIRGVDRNKVILDGEFKLENGIRILEADGVVVENMTAKNYLSNGFYWTGSDRYRGSYLTAYRNGDYGIYAFDAYHGQFDNSYGGGSPDAGFYIGECFRCDAVIDNVVSENNGLGYSGTNSGGDLYIVNSTFRYNRAGVVPNSGSYELCYPSRETVIVGNTVYGNNNSDAPAIDVALLAQGNGILMAGAVKATVERNLVFDHDRVGIGAVPFPEEDAVDIKPPASADDTPCSETRDKATAAESDIPDIVLWNARDNRIVNNNVSTSGLADLASATIKLDDTSEATADLNNCFSGNTFTSSAPVDLELLAPCDATGNGGDFEKGALDLTVLIADKAPAPPKDTYRTTPEPGNQENMPNAKTAAHPKFTAPEKPNLDSITIPAKPAE